MTKKPQNQVEDLFFEGEAAFAYWGRFYALLSISVIIATVGLYRNSGAVVIAAMLIAPLMTPILGVASALVMGWTARVARSLVAVFVSSAVTSAMAYLLLFVFDAPKGLSIPTEVMARTDPGLEELMVALAAGIAGAYMQGRKEAAGLLPGVAIGVSLVPPLSATGILLYFGETQLAWEAALLFLANFAAIVLAACAVYLVPQFRPATREKALTPFAKLGAVVSFLLVAVIAVQLGRVTLQRFQEARDEELVMVAVGKWAGPHPMEVLGVDVREDIVVLRFVFDAPLHKADQLVAPGELVSRDLDPPALVSRIREVLKREVEVVFSGMIRFTGTLDSRS